MSIVLFNSTLLHEGDIANYRPLIQKILDGELREPKIKRLHGIHYQGKTVLRAKIDKKNRLLFTYVQHEGVRTLLILAINDHNYDKAQRQLCSNNAANHEGIELNEEPLTKTGDEKTHSTDLSFTPCISFNQQTLVLDEDQLAGIQLKAPLLLTGPPGSGKTVLLYQMLEKNLDLIASQIDSNHRHTTDDADNNPPSLPVLFISPSEQSVNLLRALYQKTHDETKVPMLFTTWEGLLKSQNFSLAPVRQEQFAEWLKEKRCEESSHVIHYEFSLIAAFGSQKYLELGNRQCYYSGMPEKQKDIIALLEDWQHYLVDNQLFDPMTCVLPLQDAKYPFIFCDEAQNLSPVTLHYLIQQTKGNNFISCIDIEQCLLSSPFIHNCLKQLLHKKYKEYNEHLLRHTWRCAPEIAKVATFLLDKKHERDGARKRRIYKGIESAQESTGLVSWVDNQGLAKISHHGPFAGTVVIAESLNPAERDFIRSNLKTSNILSAKEAIGLDFDVVVLWKPIAKENHLKKHPSKKEDHLSLEQWTDISSIYVGLTRARFEVFIYEEDKHLRAGIGKTLVGELPLNAESTFNNTEGAEQNQLRWIKHVDNHLAEGRIGPAKQIMRSHLGMDKKSIEEKIESASSRIKTADNPSLKAQSPNKIKVLSKRRRSRNARQPKKKSARSPALKSEVLSRDNNLPKTTTIKPGESEQKIISSLFNAFTSNRLAVALKLLPKNSDEILSFFLWALEDQEKQSLLNFIQQDSERSKIFFSCLANQPLDIFNKIPLDALSQYVENNKPFQKALLQLLDIQKQTHDKSSSDLRPIHIAAITGNEQVLEMLIKFGADLNQADNKGVTPAYAAAEYGQIALLEKLYESGASLTQANNNGATPAYVAAQNGHDAVLRKLVQLGIDLNESNAPLACIAAYKGHSQVLHTLSKLGIDLNQTNNNFTPAFVAAQRGQVAVLQTLKDLGVNLNQTNNFGTTLAYIAAENGHVAVLEMLHHLGMDLNQANNYGITPANIAAYKGNCKVLHKLKELGADLNKPNNNDVTPALIAAQNGRVDALQTLNDLGADLNQANNRGTTPAFVAAQNGHVAVLRMLGKFGADLNRPDKTGATPAYIAAKNGHEEVLRTLKELGVDLDQYNMNGATSACFAVQNKDIAALQMLSKFGADLNKPAKNSSTPACIAALHGDGEMLCKLKELGADLNKQDITGATPAFIAAYNGLNPVLSVLKKLGADLNRPNNNNASPVLIAAYKGLLDVVSTLKELGVDLNQHTNKGLTPVFLATQNGHMDVLKFLLDNGAQSDHPYISSHNDLIKFCEHYPSDVLERMKNTIEVKLKDTKNNDHQIHLLPIDIARIIGHEEIARIIERSQQEKPEAGKMSFFAPKPDSLASRPLNFKPRVFNCP